MALDVLIRWYLPPRPKVSEPANDLSPWCDALQRRCLCGSWRFELMLLDDFPRLICSRCEMDHTEAMFPVARSR